MNRAVHMLEPLASLWRQFFLEYGEPHIRSKMLARWASDRNLAESRIQFNFPPTFQPGYVGPAYMNQRRRLLFLGYNPGEGSNPTSQAGDTVLGDWLARFAAGTETILTLGEFQASHVIKWPIYSGKGIFRETDDSSIALLPPNVRPAVRSIALLNLFPFKTVKNKKPLGDFGASGSSLKAHMWKCLLKPTLEILSPHVIVTYPDADSYAKQISTLSAHPKLLRAWHPSDYNVRAQRTGLAQAWAPLATELLEGT